MNAFNKLIVVVLLLLGIVSSLALIFTALLFPGAAINNVSEAVAALDENVTLGLQIIVAAVAAMVAIVSFFLLLLEVVPRSAKGVQLSGVSGASAELTLDAIIDRIRYETEAVPSVRSVRPKVRSRGKQIDVDLDIRTEPTVEVAAKTEEVSQIVRDAVENKMGIKLRRLRVYVHFEPYPKDSRRTNPPAPPAPPKQTPSDTGVG